MAQADFNVANQSGAGFRSDLNNQLLALGTLSSGGSAPSTTYAYQYWADTTAGILKLRNGANSGWISKETLDGNTLYGYALRPIVDNSSIVLNGGATGGANIELYGSSAGTPSYAYYDAALHTFRSANGASTYAALTSASRLGISTTSPTARIHAAAGSLRSTGADGDATANATTLDWSGTVSRLISHGATTSTYAPIQLIQTTSNSSSVQTPVSIDAVGLTTVSLGLSGAVTRSTAVTPGAVTSVTFSSLPSWIKRITVHFTGISLSGTDNFLIRLSTGGTFATTGYVSTSNYTTAGGATGGTSSTAGTVMLAGNAANTLTGSYTFTNLTGNTWVGTGTHIYDNDSTFVGSEAGKVTLSGTLDGIRILSSGSNTFDAGTVNITYEG